jgi:hypothetical protein
LKLSRCYLKALKEFYVLNDLNDFSDLNDLNDQ